jgi:hypothetical protein
MVLTISTFWSDTKRPLSRTPRRYLAEELLKLATLDIEYVNPAYAVEPGVRRGIVAVGQAMRRFAEGWESSRHELRELYDCGAGVVAPLD